MSRTRFSPYSAAFQRDPTQVYDSLLEQGSLHRTRTGTFVAVGYRECRTILSDSRFVRDPNLRGLPSFSFNGDNQYDALVRSILINLDGEEHKVVRGLFAAPFSNRNIERVKESIGIESRRLIDEMDNQPDLELVSSYARPLTIFTIKQLLEIFECDDAIISDVADKNIYILEMRRPSDREAREAKEALDSLLVVLSENIEKAPDGSFLDSLATAIHDGKIGKDTMMANLALLITAGFETTISLLCGGFYLLCKEGRLPDFGLSWVKDEVLRLAPPIHMTVRVAIENVSLGNVEVEAGTPVIVALAAANRDPSVFPEPHRFLERPGCLVPLSFGAGAHYCMGVHLARLEARIGWGALFERLGVVPPEVLSIEFGNRAAIRTPKRLMISL